MNIEDEKFDSLDAVEAHDRLLRMLGDLRDGTTRVIVIVTDSQAPFVMSLPHVRAQELLHTADRLAAVGQALLVEANERRPAAGVA